MSVSRIALAATTLFAGGATICAVGAVSSVSKIAVLAFTVIGAVFFSLSLTAIYIFRNVRLTSRQDFIAHFQERALESATKALLVVSFVAITAVSFGIFQGIAKNLKRTIAGPDLTIW